ncbi:uncharacterized protein LOC129576770 [Sitodiplosis mosellana]|uniref:uncharacterized protein LOC129576770 n=1 Tax=Sitodiplosis mosellana TaxID=263140 RepID=UPI0024443AC8|nr:uncharacterized protein LOC129576770 [Sitodiplosis mosellana]
MKLDELNLDCIELVLEHLDLIDLLNAGDSTKRLNKAAELVYAHKYGNKVVQFRSIRISPIRLFKTEGASMVVIEDLKTALQLLRCVGRMISKLHINFSVFRIIEEDIEEKLQRDRRLFKYINNYCAEFMKDFFIYSPAPVVASYRADFLTYFEKPFINVEMFGHLNYHFTEKSCLIKRFPKLKELGCGHTRNVSFYNINKIHFPHLEHLQIWEFSHIEVSLQNDMVLPILQLNPQLRELTLKSFFLNSSNLNINLIRDAVESLQNIETLFLDIKPITSIKESDNIIHMKRVKSFKIHFDKLEELPECFLPFTFEQLEKLTIHFPKADFHSSFNEEFFNFIDKHSKIKHLTIGNIDTSGDVDWLELAKSLPLLVEISLGCCLFSTDEAINLISKFRMLNQLRFKLSDNYNSFRERLGYTWEGIYKVDDKTVELKRRI